MAMLDEKRLDQIRGRNISESLAGLINGDPRLPKNVYMSGIRKFAHGRRAELHKPECWNDLEFGEALFALGFARRPKKSEV